MPLGTNLPSSNLSPFYSHTYDYYHSLFYNFLSLFCLFFLYGLLIFQLFYQFYIYPVKKMLVQEY